MQLPGVEYPSGRRDADHVEHKSPEEVQLDDVHDELRQFDQQHQLRQVVRICVRIPFLGGGDHYISGLEGDVHVLADSHADVSNSKCASVVHAIPNHQHRALLVLQSTRLEP